MYIFRQSYNLLMYLAYINLQLFVLKGVCHKIFDPYFSSSLSPEPMIIWLDFAEILEFLRISAVWTVPVQEFEQIFFFILLFGLCFFWLSFCSFFKASSLSWLAG